MSAPRPRVLVVEDERGIREALAGALADAGYVVTVAAGVVEARRAVEDVDLDAVLLDIRLRDGDGLELLAELRAARPRLPVVMATAYGDSARTISAMKLGAFEYLTKPFDLDLLLATLARATQAPPAARAPEADGEGELVGSSPAMLRVWKAIGRAAASVSPVLVTGESGVGKELVARAIHAHGDRHARPFVAVNVAALPPSLVESELFGHERGAFTGAVEQHVGRFELAADGTLFLDEIGDLEPALQTKLLRVLEDGRFERVGGTRALTSSARIVAATSRPVLPGHPGATIREDLYYRLGVIHLEVPPLRERRQDIPLLVERFLARRTGPRRALSEAAMERLARFDWPGNVRQLRHVVESACVMSSAEVVDVDALALPAPSAAGEPDVGGAPASSTRAAPLDDDDLDLRANLERLERRLITRALELAGGNRAEAARRLGIRRALLYARMAQLGLES